MKGAELTNVNGVKEAAESWWDKLDLEKWFGESSADAVQVAICFVSFFAIGFLFKKYLKFIFLCLLVSALVIKGLEYYKILDIDWEAFNTFLGLEPTATISSVGNMIVEWVKTHVVITISSIVGFLIGYKLG